MVDDRRREARPIRGNVTTGGRYGTAEDKLHVEPEVPPLPQAETEGRVPESLGGALPENEGREERDDERPQR